MIFGDIMIFLPTNKKEMKKLGYNEVDFVVVTGDAYVDHPSFGTSLIARYLESFGYKIAIISQPQIKDINSIKKCSKPRLAFLVSSGNIDSMVNNYYVSKKKRKKDVYSVNGKNNKRPDYAVNEYCWLIRKAYNDIPIIIGGIEASLRRFSHYDYWQDKILPSILISSSADLLVYSMGEKAILEIANCLNSGLSIKDITFVKGTAYLSNRINYYKDDYILLPEYKEVVKDKMSYIKSFMIQYRNNEAQSAKILIEKYDDNYLIQNVNQEILNSQEFDHIFDLPFSYLSYDEYQGFGTITALKEIQFSINVTRGCNGACNFCAITFHQGKQISMRSANSCCNEALKMQTLSNYKGYIHDVGGPTANFNDDMCQKQKEMGSCFDKECLGNKMCPNLKISHEKYFDILRKIRTMDNVKKVFVRSGIRYDYLLKDDKKYLVELIKYHISGQLRLAPEHASSNVLKLMNKPNVDAYDEFVDLFNSINNKLNLKQFVVPYLMSSHPGSSLNDAYILYKYLKKIKYRPMQSSVFYPTPSTISTLMYYTKINPFNNQKIEVAKTNKEKELQNALLQYHLPKNKARLKEALSLISKNKKA